MQNHDELKDILLDKEEDLKGVRLKKVLIIIAAFSILFLIVIATMKIVNSDSSQDEDIINGRLNLPPTPQVAQQKQKESLQINKLSDFENKGDEQLFEQVPIVPEGKAQNEFEDMVKKLKEKDKPKSKVDSSAQSIKSVSKKLAENSKSDISKSQDKKIEKKVSKPKSTVKKEPIAKPKKPVAKAAPKSMTKKVIPVAQKVSSNLYVQVLSTSRLNPDKKFLQKIKDAGYSYKVIKKGSVSKVIVGPFEKSDLKSAILNLRNKINKGAFVYRLK